MGLFIGPIRRPSRLKIPGGPKMARAASSNQAVDRPRAIKLK